MGKATSVDHVKQMLAEAREDVAHADQKASILLAALGIGFGAVLAGQLAGGWDSSQLTSAGQAAWWVGVLLAISSVGASALAVWPRYETRDIKDGIAYWGHVAGFDDFMELEDALDDQRLGKRRDAHQLWRLSRLVRTKYRHVRASLALAAFAGVLLAVAVLVFR